MSLPAGSKRGLAEVGAVDPEFSPHYKHAKIDAMAVSTKNFLNFRIFC